MAQRTLPGLGLTGYWPLGYDGWKDEMDVNLRLLSLICQANFLDFVAAEPGSPTNGDIYIFTDGAEANKFLVRDDGDWVYIAARTGTIAFNQNTGTYYTFDGSNWNELSTGSSGEGDYQDSVRIFTFGADGNVDWETGGEITVQGVALVDGDRVGLGDQDLPEENLLYIVRSAGTWDRAEGWEDGDPLTSGVIVPVDEGTYSGNIFQLVTPNPITIGTSEFVWKNNSRSGRTNFSGTNKTGDFTFAVGDNRRWFYLTKAGDQDVLIPTHADVAIPNHSEMVVQYYGGSGTKTITADTGVYLNGVNGGSIELTDDGTAWWLKKRSKTTWVALPIGFNLDPAYTDEMAQDAIASAFAAGSHTGITITYNDVSNSFDFAATGSYTSENARDDIAAMIAAGSHTGITITNNDGSNSMDFAVTVTQYTDEMAQDAVAAAFAAGSHTGITITYNDASGSFDFASSGGYTAENARDDIGAALVGGTGITVTPNDGADTITIASTITQYTDELAQDALAAAFAAGSHTNLTITYNDASGGFDFAVSGIASYTAENARDDIGAALVGGTGITVAVNDGADTITLATTITQYTDEMAQDAAASMITAGTHVGVTASYNDASNSLDLVAKPTESIIVAVSDETTAITTGVAKVTFRMPYAFTLTDIRASLSAAGSGTTTVDVNESGATIMTTHKLNFDASEKTTTTYSGTAATLTDTSLADDAEITIDIDAAGASAAGLKVYLIGHRT